MITGELEKKRNALELSQERVAQLTGVSRQYYNAIENGKRVPSVNLAKEIAKVLKVDWVIFFKC